MPNKHNFLAYAERARAAYPAPLVRVSYQFSNFLAGKRGNWFSAFGLPGLEFGWRYRIDFVSLSSEESNLKSECYEQDESFSLTLAGAHGAVQGKLPAGIWPWTDHLLETEVHGPWGVISDFHRAVAIEQLHGSDWLAEKIMTTELLKHRLEQASTG